MKILVHSPVLAKLCRFLVHYLYWWFLCDRPRVSSDYPSVPVHTELSYSGQACMSVESFLDSVQSRGGFPFPFFPTPHIIKFDDH